MPAHRHNFGDPLDDLETVAPIDGCACQCLGCRTARLPGRFDEHCGDRDLGCRVGEDEQVGARA